MLEFIRENKLVTVLFIVLICGTISLGFNESSKPPYQTLYVQYQNQTVDTITIQIKRPQLENSCIADGRGGKQFVCGVRSFKVLKIDD